MENVFLKMLPITLAVFVGFLTIGLPLPVLPLHLHYTLGMSPLVVGIAIGTQFAAALLSRAWAGGLADTRGAQTRRRHGPAGRGHFPASAYLSSLAFIGDARASLGVLLLGRVLLGCGESLVITGALSWGIGLVGPHNAGKVMAWVGIAMFAAYAAGAPLGTLIYGRTIFSASPFATIVIPLLALAVVAPARAVAVTAARRVPFYKVLGAVWVPGLGLLLCSVGFGVITTFIALLFAAKNWGSASLAFTSFGVAFIGARLLFAHLPDKIGGAKVALVCVLIETAGQLLIWQASGVADGLCGRGAHRLWLFAGLPRLWRRSGAARAAASRGVAMGAFMAFLDMSLGLTGPAAGAIASAAGVNTVYLAGAFAVRSRR